MKAPGVAALLLVGVTSARADVYIVNATGTQYSVAVTLPNGKVTTRKMDAVSSALAQEQFIISPGIDKLGVEITDDQGNVAWKGTSGRDDVQVITQGAKGIQVVYGGFYGGSSVVRSEVLMDVTGDGLTVDLFGANGKHGVKGLKPGPTFDAKKAAKLDASESSYEIHVTSKDGKAAQAGKAQGFHYLLLWKTDGGEYRSTELGTIPPPPASKKK